jgi:hypothetical protein
MKSNISHLLGDIMPPPPFVDAVRRGALVSTIIRFHIIFDIIIIIIIIIILPSDLLHCLQNIARSSEQNSGKLIQLECPKSVIEMLTIAKSKDICV